MGGEEQAIIAFIVGLVCCLGIGVFLLAVGGFLLWKRSKSDDEPALSSQSRPDVAEDDADDTLVSERPSDAPPPPTDDGPSIATQRPSGNLEPPTAPKPQRQAAQTIIAFDDDFDDDEEL